MKHFILFSVLLLLLLVPSASANHWLTITPANADATGTPAGVTITMSTGRTYDFTSGMSNQPNACSPRLNLGYDGTHDANIVVTKTGILTVGGTNGGGTATPTTLLRHVNVSATAYYYTFNYTPPTTWGSQFNATIDLSGFNGCSFFDQWTDTTIGAGSFKCTNGAGTTVSFVNNSTTATFNQQVACHSFSNANGKIMGLTQNGTEITPPNSPVLSASVVSIPLPARCVLVWTTPTSSPPIQGYNVTETSDYGAIFTYNLSLVNTLSLFVHSRTYNYTVHAWNSIGNSAESNIASCVQTGTLAGDKGFLYGGDRAGQANSLGISTSATDMFWAILITLFGVMVGFMSLARAGYGGIGASLGGLIALVFEFALSLVPTWAILFELVVFAALFGASRKLRERAA